MPDLDTAIRKAKLPIMAPTQDDKYVLADEYDSVKLTFRS